MITLQTFQPKQARVAICENGQRDDGVDRVGPTTAFSLASVVKLGSRDGIGAAQTIDDRYQDASLFL